MAHSHFGLCEEEGSHEYSLLYFTILNEESKSLGFLKKVRSQCVAFEKLGRSVFLGILRNNEYDIYRVADSSFERETSFHFDSRMASITNRASILKRIKNQQVLSQIMRFTQEWCEKKEIDAVYIRIFALSHLVMRFLRTLSRQCKIIWEYPTSLGQANTGTPIVCLGVL